MIKELDCVMCPRCKGIGFIELTGVYAETLELLRKQKTKVTGAELGRIAGCKGEAMCNRLRALEARGLAKGERWGATRFMEQHMSEDLDYDLEPDWREQPEDEWGCCFPDKCCMAGIHRMSECHTAEMMEAYYREQAKTCTEEPKNEH